MAEIGAIPSTSPRSALPHLMISTHPSCQDNEEGKRKGARSVAAYMQLSDAVFTPYAESLYPTSGGEREVRTDSGRWGLLSGPGRVSEVESTWLRSGGNRVFADFTLRDTTTGSDRPQALGLR